MIQIKTFPDFDMFSINHKEIFAQAQRNTKPSLSDITFNNLYGWHVFFNYKVSRFEELLFIHCQLENKLIIGQPIMLSASASYTQQFASLCSFLRVYKKENGLEVVFKNISQVCLKNIDVSGLRALSTLDSFDYVYSLSDLCELKGEKFSPKRNLIKQFQKKYSYSYEPLSPTNIAAAIEFAKTISTGTATNTKDMKLYCIACILLESYNALELYGGLVFIDNKVCGLTIASIERHFEYSDGIFPTVVVHTENADQSYKSIYQALNNFFVSSLPKDIVYVNREEDMGISGLRKAKQSYQPARFVEKTELTLL